MFRGRKYISKALITSRGEIIKDVSELEGTVTDVKNGFEVVLLLVAHRRQPRCLRRPRRISPHHLWSCLPRQRRQRCTAIKLN